jgi:hypothetical protein
MPEKMCTMVLDSAALFNPNCSKKQGKKSRPDLCLESGVFLPM